MFAEERRQTIVQALRARGRVQASELAARFSVAEETIRRDLKWLEETGQAVRTHGGAIRRDSGPLPPLAERATTSNEAKRAIGASAAGLVRDGQSIFIDSGSTALELAAALRNKNDLHVVTNSLLVAGELAAATGIEVHLPGGTLYTEEMCLVGPDAVAGFAQYRADMAFISCAGLDVARGVAVFNPFEAEVKRAMLKNCAHRVVIADASKLGRTALVAVAPLSSLHSLITDASIDKGMQARLRQAGLEVKVAVPL